MFDRIRGVDEFIKEIKKIVGSKDLVVADRILFSNISYKMRNGPNNLYMPFEEGGAVTNHFQMSSPLMKTQKKDFYLIGSKDDVSYLDNENEIKFLKDFDVPFSSSKLQLYEVIFK